MRQFIKENQTSILVKSESESENVKDIIENKKFCKTVESFYSDKSKNFANIFLIGNGKLLTDDFQIAETFNKYF